jgi:Ca2+-binding RTX toxin-like protein
LPLGPFGAFDIREGEAGDDTIYGGNGDDTVYGNDGEDLIYGEDGEDVIYGEDSEDTIFGGDSDDELYGGDANDVMYGGEDKDWMEGGDQNDYMEGNADNDTMFGDEMDDTMLGGDGRDYLDGGDGVDILEGGAGDDVLVGGSNNTAGLFANSSEILTGGDGDDRFVFDVIIDGDTSHLDQVYDKAEDISEDIITDLQCTFKGDDFNDGLIFRVSGDMEVDTVAELDEYVTVQQEGADVIIFFDRDGLDNDPRNPPEDRIILENFDVASNINSLQALVEFNVYVDVDVV